MMCFSAGANAVFTGEKMLTTECNGWEEDKAMFDRWGLKPMESKHDREARERKETPTAEFGSSSWETVKDQKEATTS